jgi:glutamyl-tRNA reductase
VITLAGISHHTAPLEVRERLAIPAERVPDVLAHARRRFGAAALLSTCNRLELYLSGAHERDEVLDFLAGQFRAADDLVDRHFQFRYGPDAVRHLYEVAAGIDSMVIGESEILGQVRAAFSAAVAAGADDALLSRLFHTAIRTGRRARSETEIGRHALSVSSIAVQQARTLFPQLELATVLVIGAGEASRLAAEALLDQGAGRLLVANRTYERGHALAGELGGEALPFDQLEDALARSHVVLASTGAPDTLVDLPTVHAALARREGRVPLLVVDIGMPRDFDPAVRDLPGVTYRDLDDLQAIADANAQLRQAEVERVRELVDAETGRFLEWWEQLQVIPTISALTDRSERLRAAEVAKTLRRLRLGEAERAHVEELFDALSKALVKQLLHDPIAALRERGDRDVYLEATRRLFRLDEPAGLDRADGATDRTDAGG